MASNDHTCASCIFGLMAVIINVIALIYGILALVPSKPFNEPHIGLGVTLVVCSVTGINGIAAYFFIMAISLGFICIGTVIELCIRTLFCCPKTRDLTEADYINPA